MKYEIEAKGEGFGGDLYGFWHKESASSFLWHSGVEGIAFSYLRTTERERERERERVGRCRRSINPRGGVVAAMEGRWRDCRS